MVSFLCYHATSTTLLSAITWWELGIYVKLKQNTNSLFLFLAFPNVSNLRQFSLSVISPSSNWVVCPSVMYPQEDAWYTTTTASVLGLCCHLATFHLNSELIFFPGEPSCFPGGRGITCECEKPHVVLCHCLKTGWQWLSSCAGFSSREEFVVFGSCSNSA